MHKQNTEHRRNKYTNKMQFVFCMFVLCPLSGINFVQSV